MEPRSPEEEPTKVEVIHVGEEFTLFTPHRTKANFDDWLKKQLYSSDIALQLDTGEQIPFTIRTAVQHGASSLQQNIFFSPFSPELNYNLDGRDKDEKSRLEKMLDHSHRLSFLYDKTDQVPYGLNIHTNDFNALVKQGIVDYDSLEFTKEYAEVIRRLWLFVSVPTDERPLHYEAQPYDTHGGLEYTLFHPSDFGELAAAKTPTHRDNPLGEPGLPLRIPSNITKLQTMRGRFLLVPERAIPSKESLPAA